MEERLTYTAFVGQTLVCSGSIETILPTLKARFDHNPGDLLLIFEDHTGRQVDFDLRGPLKEVIARMVPPQPRVGPGRPKLGVISREVSLLPRHWDWLEHQPNGASAALRRLVEQAKKQDPDEQRMRLGREAVGRFMTAMAGNLPGYEEATRALYARNHERFEELIQEWPPDIRAHILGMFEKSLEAYCRV